MTCQLLHSQLIILLLLLSNYYLSSGYKKLRCDTSEKQLILDTKNHSRRSERETNAGFSLSATILAVLSQQDLYRAKKEKKKERKISGCDLHVKFVEFSSILRRS